MTQRSSGLVDWYSVSVGLRLFVAVTASVGLVACGDDDGGTQGGKGGSVSTGGTMPSGAGGGGATATGGSGGGTAVSLASLHSSILAPRCLSCHAGSGASGMLDMSTPQSAYANLVGSSGTGVAAMGTGSGTSGTACSSVAGLMRVVPGSPNNSLLWQKVNAKLQGSAVSCGSPMPLDNTTLTQAEVDRIAAWIANGTPNS